MSVRVYLVVLMTLVASPNLAQSQTFQTICGYINISGWPVSAIGHAFLYSNLGASMWNYAGVDTNVSPPPNITIQNNPRSDNFFLPGRTPPAVWHNVSPSYTGTYTVTGFADVWGEYYDDEYDQDFIVFYPNVFSCNEVGVVP